MNNTTDDRLLFHQIAQGNKEAFDAFFDRYYPKLIQFAGIYLNSMQQAEDVVSDVLVSLLMDRQRVFSLGHFESYLYAAVKNKALTAKKKFNRVSVISQGVQSAKRAASKAATPHEIMIEEELLCLTQKIIDNFPPKRKRVFQLVREEEHTYRQAAQVMDISERTVEVHLRMAMKALRTAVENYFNEKETTESIMTLTKMLTPLFLSGSIF